MPLWPFHHRTKDIWRRQMTIRKRRILRGQLFRRASPTGQLKLYISSKTQFINVRCFCECCFFSWIYPTGHLMPTYPLMCSEFHKLCSTLLICPSKARCFIIMTISHKWNWSSPLCFYCGYFLFIWTDVSYSQESVSSAGIIPQGCCSFTQPPPSLDGGLKY